MQSAQLEEYLGRIAKSGKADPFWLVTGNDGFLTVESGDMIRAAVRSMGYTDRQVLDMTGTSDWSRLTMAAADIGMFDDKKLVEVRLPGGKAGREGPAVIQRYLESPVEGVVTMFVIPAPDWAGAKAAWWQALNKLCTVVDCSVPPRSALPMWLHDRMKKRGLDADQTTLEDFADLIEGNLFAAHQEIEKLSLLFPGQTVTREQIRASVSDSSRFDLSALFTSIWTGEAERVVRIIDGLEAQNEALPFVLAMLTSDIRKLVKLRAGYDNGQRFVKGVFATPELNAAARRLSTAKLANALTVCAEIDRLSKGLSSPARDSDPWLELKSVALFLAR